MIALALGLGAVALLLWAAQRFSAAEVSSIKGLLAWVVALAGLSLVAMLLFTGRGATALGGLVLLGPLAWSWWQEAKGTARTPAGSKMDRTEALGVLGLHDPVSEADIRAAWVRLMRTVHPDSGGSDWLAARVNQAKDVLLGRR